MEKKEYCFLLFKSFTLITATLVFYFLVSLPIFAQNDANLISDSDLIRDVAASPEVILRFSSQVVINKDASLKVTETIQIKTINNATINHGIYRDFPTLYQGPYGSIFKVGFDVQNVLRDGEQEPFRTTAIKNGIRLYIGDPNVTLSPGTYTYVINYTTNRQIGFFEQYDELYWNITGNDWNYPIEKAEVVIDLPEEAHILQSAAYTGVFGAKGQDFSMEKLETNGIFFATTRPLLPHEGLTIAVAWQKGVVHPPNQFDSLLYFLNDNLTLLLAVISFLIVCLYYFIVWYRIGRDPRKGTLIPLFFPPKNISPAAMIYIKDMGFSSPWAISRVFSASIVNLAVKGILSIIKYPDYFSLERKNSTNGSSTNAPVELGAEELFIADTLLPKPTHVSPEGIPSKTKPFDLSRLNHKIIRENILKYQKIIEEKYANTYFVINKKFFSLGLVLSFLAYLLVQFFKQPLGDQDSIMTVLFFALIVINILFLRLLKAPTLLGQKIMDEIEGFKMFLSVTETERYKILNAPEVTTEVFEKYLPYAIALNVETEWSKRLVQPEAYAPEWYQGDKRKRLDTKMGSLAAISSLGRDMASNITTVAPINPPSKSSGSSGQGGSGRGGGGGGGGGW